MNKEKHVMVCVSVCIRERENETGAQETVVSSEAEEFFPGK